MASTRAVRMELETVAQVQRLSRACGLTQNEVLRRAVQTAYELTLKSARYGPILRLMEQAGTDEDGEA